ncbi:5' nucleotidase, NT5C type [Desulfogranum mediterraneum]|uniref:5' nucleotidase, NT5C type n=1 Tax=Desulfogranum mediterraneum TaxID=160661 RepID=UPI001E4B86CF|nr:hypothetical protein [Desulfogranum mediterraneum]
MSATPKLEQKATFQDGQQLGPRISPGRIGFDFDGVIADTAEAFIRIACEQYDHCAIRLEEITRFEVEECLDMDEGLVEQIFSQILHDSLGSGLLPMPGAVPVLEELSDHGQITIITARPLADPVHRWLEHHLPVRVRDQTQVIAMGDHDDKLRHIHRLELSHFIDDREATCIQLAEAGVRSILFSQPWNRSQHALPRVRDWDDIRALCL